jgi:uncharacterized membrane protein
MRALGRSALKGKWPAATLAMIITMLMLQVPYIIINSFFGKEQVINFAKMLKDAGMGKYVTEEIEKVTYTIYYSPVSQIYVLLVTGAIAFGITIFFMNLFRAGSQTTGDVFKGFGYYARVTGLFFYMLLFIILWGIIPFAGLILAPIAAIRYSQSFFVAFDHPEYPIPLCVAESKVLMLGNKGKYFLLQLSFIGWALVAGIIGGMIVSGITYMMTSGGTTLSFLSLQLISLISSVIMCPVTAYLMSTNVAFYEIVTGKIEADVYYPEMPF